MGDLDLSSTPILYEAIRLVKGATNCLVIDLQRKSYFTVDTFTYEFLCNIYQKQSISNLFDKYPKNDHDVIIDNLKLLVNHELIFLTKNPEWFPYISEDWDSSQVITNAIFDISPYNFNYFESFLDQIIELGCQHLQVRDWDFTYLNTITEIIRMCMDKDLLGVELISNYDKILNKKASYIINDNPKINQIILFGAPNNQITQIENSDQVIRYITDKNLSEKSCGCININYFTIGTDFFFESKKHNTCLNRKISIDRQGFIKNCPSMLENFGHIDNVILSDVVNNAEFQKYWDITKDKIHVCKDCEYRYVCTDCRA